MKFSAISSRLSGLGSEKWAVHIEGKSRADRGEPVIFLSIGEPDLPPPVSVLDVAGLQMKRGGLKYAPGRGGPNVLASLARHYTKSMKRAVGADQFLVLPGTQTALFLAFMSILEAGDEVIMFDPYYATYEGVVTAPGGVPVAVALDPDRGFHPDLEKLNAAITPRSRAILLNSPSNPTGAVFTTAEMRAIGDVAKAHDLWIVSDEVYAQFIHGPNQFASPFMQQDLEERTIVVSSISKSHAVPGFRAGWIAASRSYCARVLPLTETMLFGSQPFLQDALAHALDHEFPEVDHMRRAYVARAHVLRDGLQGSNRISTRLPEGGMFMMLDVRKTGLSGEDFARRLLQDQSVVTMPGESFGACGAGHVRVALTVDEATMAEAAGRILAFASRL